MSVARMFASASVACRRFEAKDRQECRALEFLHFNASARRPSHVQSSLQETGMMQSGFRLPRPVLLLGPVGEPHPSSFSSPFQRAFIPLRSRPAPKSRNGSSPQGSVPKEAPPRWRAPPGGQRRPPGRRSGRPQPLEPDRSLHPAAPPPKKAPHACKSPQPLRPVTYLLFLYPLSCQHLRPPAPRNAQPRLVKCE